MDTEKEKYAEGVGIHVSEAVVYRVALGSIQRNSLHRHLI